MKERRSPAPVRREPAPPAAPTRSGGPPERVRPRPAPRDGVFNQGGAAPHGIDYQRDLGIEQDA